MNLGIKNPHDVSLTAKKTANWPDSGGQRRTILECASARSNYSGPLWTRVDGNPAIFKTVWGVHRRPTKFGFVRRRSSSLTLTAIDSQVRSVDRPLDLSPGQTHSRIALPSLTVF